MPLRILITGFEPFQGNAHNPSGDIATELNDRPLTAFVANPPEPGFGLSVPSFGSRVGAVRGVVLPVVWGAAGAQLRSLIASYHPHIAVSLGMAQGAVYRVESAARDFNAPYEDNLHHPPAATRDYPTEPERLATALPIGAIERAIRGAGGTPASSSDAGGFLCEDVFYELMRFYRQRGAATQLFRAGFIHVPYDPADYRIGVRAGMVAAIRAAVTATVADLTPAEYATARASP